MFDDERRKEVVRLVRDNMGTTDGFVVAALLEIGLRSWRPEDTTRYGTFIAEQIGYKVEKPVEFEWREAEEVSPAIDLITTPLHGYTITPEGRETKVFEIFRLKRKFYRPCPIRLYRVSSHGVEDFKTVQLAKNWAETLLTKGTIIRKEIVKKRI